MEKPTEQSPVRRTEYYPLRQLFRKWDTFSKNIKQYPAKAPILLPDLFAVYERGVDMREIIGQIDEFLANKKNLMDFYGDVPFLEFLLTYTKPDEPFAELNRLIEDGAKFTVSTFEIILHYCSPHSDFPELIRLMNAVRSAAGFRNHFRGIVHININEWVGHHEEPCFAELLDYLSENSRNWLIVLSVENDPKRKQDIELLRSVAAMFLRLESVTIKLPGAEYYLDMFSGMLGGYGISLSPASQEKLLETIKVISKNRYFCGTYNINCLADDVVYTLYTRPGSPKQLLEPEDLEEFGPDSEYVKRMIQMMERKSAIGFGN